jgi:formylglycine-generating enzyme required for sulfatase activity
VVNNTIVLCAVIFLSVVSASALESSPMAGGDSDSELKDSTTGIEMVLVKGGCYQMGSAFDIGGPEEKPVHKVCVDDYYLGKFEVTQGQWKVIMGNNPSRNKCGDDCPVENVSWNDVQDFIKKLNGKIVGENNTIVNYRLPTEAEWEFAARSRGEVERSYSAKNVHQLIDVAWYNLNTESIRPVGQKPPNGLGLFDMSGNVAEWTNDWYGSTYYATSPSNNPTGPNTGERRVVRGGSYVDYPFDLRATYRNYLPPDYRSGSKGFRLVGVINQSKSVPQKVKSQKLGDAEKK